MVKLAKILEIKGEETSEIDSRLGTAILLSAEYQGEKYNLAKISGGFWEGKGGLIFQFNRADGKSISNGLNAVLLMTNCNGTYRATGMSSLDGRKFEGYLIGDDVEIIVEELADDTIRKLRDN